MPEILEQSIQALTTPTPWIAGFLAGVFLRAPASALIIASLTAGLWTILSVGHSVPSNLLLTFAVPVGMAAALIGCVAGFVAQEMGRAHH